MTKVIMTPSVEAKRTFSKEMNHLKANQQILTILVLLFISMIFWIIVSLFSSQTSSKISPDIKKLAKPLTPTLSVEALDTLESKQAISDQDLASFPIFVIQTDSTTQTQRIVEL
ncbi:MAG: hypothetical protein COY81_03335 [Candidatus Pacebacteria bacterium CG_4_10_14_0_8_um_filter_43_12]|nr:MAG: hypothetical protein COU66_03135 [Candidatus Pacebacteria bacterium CG10_big_fil_rev_8_21_14_0_10_44_11]PIY79284.1 MAG: hypothetical protein COY81_03335 [Candidatus Pacebacteria bacterium CG_4_10_14_0_8_um_filter_43_12]